MPGPVPPAPPEMGMESLGLALIPAPPVINPALSLTCRDYIYLPSP